MANAILQAIASGFTSKKVLETVAKKFPKYGPAIAMATSMGYSPNVILKKLVNPNKGILDADDYLTDREKAAKTQKANRNKERAQAIGALGTAGAIAAGAYGAFNKESPLDAWKKQVLNAPPGSAPPEPPSTPPTSFPSSPTESPIKERTPEREKLLKIAENLPEEKPQTVIGEGIKPTEIKTPIINVPRVETQFPHLKNMVDKQLQAGKSPEEIYESVKRAGIYKGPVESYEKQVGKSYLDRIKELAGDQRSKAAEVITPLGIGTIHNEKGDNAFVKIDDKLHKIPKIEAEPIPKEWENISVDLTKVPESDRSAPLNFFASTPDRKSAFVRYWSGHKPMLYEYYRKDGKEFDEETLNSITNETDAPISSGMKFSGAWTQNGKSRGSANFHKLVKMAQEEGQPDDPSKPLSFKRINITFEHGFMKEFQNKLLKSEKAFDEYHKSPKRKKKSNS